MAEFGLGAHRWHSVGDAAGLEPLVNTLEAIS